MSDKLERSGYVFMSPDEELERMWAEIKYLRKANQNALKKLDAMYTDSIKYPQLRLPEMQMDRLRDARAALGDSDE
jgi:hypothetical protein